LLQPILMTDRKITTKQNEKKTAIWSFNVDTLAGEMVTDDTVALMPKVVLVVLVNAFTNVVLVGK
jgi:hypothetical protein